MPRPAQALSHNADFDATRWLAAVEHATTNPSTLRVATSLLSEADSYGGVPGLSIDFIAESAKICRAGAKRSLRDLEAANLLERVARHCPTTGATRRNKYRLILGIGRMP